jgi:hypothetical protein
METVTGRIYYDGGGKRIVKLGKKKYKPIGKEWDKLTNKQLIEIIARLEKTRQPSAKRVKVPKVDYRAYKKSLPEVYPEGYKQSKHKSTGLAAKPIVEKAVKAKAPKEKGISFTSQYLGNVGLDVQLPKRTASIRGNSAELNTALVNAQMLKQYNESLARKTLEELKNPSTDERAGELTKKLANLELQKQILESTNNNLQSQIASQASQASLAGSQYAQSQAAQSQYAQSIASPPTSRRFNIPGFKKTNTSSTLPYVPPPVPTTTNTAMAVRKVPSTGALPTNVPSTTTTTTTSMANKPPQAKIPAVIPGAPPRSAAALRQAEISVKSYQKKIDALEEKEEEKKKRGKVLSATDQKDLDKNRRLHKDNIDILKAGGVVGYGKMMGFGEGEAPYLNDAQITFLMKSFPNYLGTVPYDYISKLKPPSDDVSSFIYNTEDHTKKGEHWSAVFISPLKQRIYHYDSFGRAIPIRVREQIEELIHKNFPHMKLKLKINRIVNQANKSVKCGYYAMRFLWRMYSGDDWKDATGWNNIKQNEEEMHDFMENMGGRLEKYGYL